MSVLCEPLHLTAAFSRTLSRFSAQLLHFKIVLSVLCFSQQHRTPTEGNNQFRVSFSLLHFFVLQLKVQQF